MIAPITRTFTAALSICAHKNRSMSSVFTNRTVADSQIISILLSYNILEFSVKHLYYSLSDSDVRTYIKLVFSKNKRKIIKANEIKSP